MAYAKVRCDLGDPYVKKWLDGLADKGVRFFLNSEGVDLIAGQFMICPNGAIMACHEDKGTRFIDYEIPLGITCKNHVIID